MEPSVYRGKKTVDVSGFCGNAENYMQSLLNYAGLLCKYGAMDELASLYQEINTICDEINAQYPDAYGMLRPKGHV